MLCARGESRHPWVVAVAGTAVRHKLRTTDLEGTSSVADAPTSGGGIRPGSDRLVWRFVSRWWWMIALAVVGGAAIGILTAANAPELYEARTIVFASQTSIPAEDFENLGISAFSTDAVIEPVIEELGLDASVREVLGSGQLEAEAITDTAAVRIIGRASDPQLAGDLANTAAESFANTTTFNGMGNFSQFGNTAVPDTPTPAPTRLYAAVGGVVGAITVVLILLVLYFFTQPILSEEDAAEAFDADSALTARVHLPARWSRRARREVEVRPHGFLEGFRHHLPAQRSERLKRICYVVLESRRRGRSRTMALMNLLAGTPQRASVKPNSSPAKPIPSPAKPNPSSEAGADRSPKVAPKPSAGIALKADDARLQDALSRSGAVVAIVPEGSSRERLRILSEEVRVTPGTKRRVVVLVRRATRRSLRGDRRRRSIVDQTALQQPPLPRESAKTQARNT
jgi:capsular polysaccharide biosynthesis protein